MEPGDSLPHKHKINYSAAWLRSWQVDEAENKVVAECKYFAAEVGLLHHRKRNCDYWWRDISRATAIFRNPHSLLNWIGLETHHPSKRCVHKKLRVVCWGSIQFFLSYTIVYQWDRAVCCFMSAAAAAAAAAVVVDTLVKMVYVFCIMWPTNILFSVWPLCPRGCSLLV
jgi:hypothetical protein